MHSYRSRPHLHPMSVLRSTVSLLGVYNVDAEERSMEAIYHQSIELMAKLPQLLRLLHAYVLVKCPQSKRRFRFCGIFLYMLNGVEPSEIEIEAMNKALILHADHELNASTFAARVCARL